MIQPVTRHPARDVFEEVLQRLAMCMGVRRSHDKGHSRVRSTVAEFIESIQSSLAADDRKAFRLVVRDGRITHDGRALGLSDGTIHAIGKLMKKRGCGGLVFRSDLTSASVNALLDWLMGRRARPAASSCTGMEVLEPSPLDRDATSRVPLGLAKFQRVFHLAEASQALMEQIGAEIRQGHALDLSEVRELARWTAEVLADEGLRVVAPALLDPPTQSAFGHPSQVFLLACAFLHPYARSREELESFCMAVFLHDIGIAHMPDNLLRRAGRSSDEGQAEIRNHPRYGADILLQCSGLPPLALEVAYCHHFHDDGTGYPEVERALRSGPVSDAVQVADRLEQLTRTGPGHPRMSVEQALDTLLTDPAMAARHDVIHAYRTGLTTMPPGTLVRLRTGARGVVLDAFPETPMRPLLAIIKDRSGRRLRDPIELDLRQPHDPDHEIELVLPRPDKRI
jgi:HD-GYP domain-containing protein (c-di-GMP phosphodiesterase class II)